MDGLDTLIAQLRNEVELLEKPLREREAREDAQLDLQQRRRDAAQLALDEARLARSRYPLALEKVEARRAELDRRITGWRGELWRIGYGSAAVLMVPLVLVDAALWRSWQNPTTASLVFVAQLAFLGILYLVIPEKK